MTTSCFSAMISPVSLDTDTVFTFSSNVYTHARYYCVISHTVDCSNGSA